MAKDDEKKESGEWKEFFWNPRTHELLGRTASSWGLILLFYLIFYTFLAGMFCLTMYVMLLTLDDYRPTWQDRLATPGMMIRPKGDPLEIVYNVEKTESWDSYIQALDNFLALDVLRLLLQVIGLKPSNDEKSPFVSCSAKAQKMAQTNETNAEVEYFPQNGTFNLMYYPYYGKRAQVNYSQPLVAVKFTDISFNTDFNVECKINSSTQFKISERDKFAGRVIFKLRINKA
ncbi:sodium/potassium-transporting ATPase subunit beta-2-like [Sinocyclocheilus grahami]|uniref:sodium/potassium-transporting ATPase subunit beta-2-like n=1 Tax=Sinocyclocheilus grahami TaxID=75366 RepID=UPI0007AD45C9|nr:PREDICTED: sodium/potassium-transporting ATPase subunit beta-2-like [Sinocyclocheilus grahami]